MLLFFGARIPYAQKELFHGKGKALLHGRGIFIDLIDNLHILIYFL
jgi:hypothetical protein